LLKALTIFKVRSSKQASQVANDASFMFAASCSLHAGRTLLGRNTTVVVGAVGRSGGGVRNHFVGGFESVVKQREDFYILKYLHSIFPIFFE
jgi:hypothetical protein